jgi:hypothetical protein
MLMPHTIHLFFGLIIRADAPYRVFSESKMQLAGAYIQQLTINKMELSTTPECFFLNVQFLKINF